MISPILFIVTSVISLSSELAPTPFDHESSLTYGDMVRFSIHQRNLFEDSGRLPMENVHDPVTGAIIYSPQNWVDRVSAAQVRGGRGKYRRLTDSSSAALITCPDGVTTCDSKTSSCRNCFCYVAPFTQTVYGTTMVGANGNCVWSNCVCKGLSR